jgi:cytochrome c oxidase subunit 2
VTDTRADYLRVQQVYLPIAIAVFVIVVVLVAFAVIRYRRRGDEWEVSQKSESKAEYVYAVALAAIAAFLVAWTFRTENREDPLAAGPALDVRVVGSQWTWRFDYPGTRKSVIGTNDRAPTLVVPAGVRVRFSLTSPDVIHSFWIPARRFKRDAFPGTVTRFDLMWPAPALDSGGACAEFCGIGHDTMRFDVRAIPRGEFQSWVSAP